MTLAGMVNFDEDALVCDFAETYHIYDYKALPVKLAATLAAGLRDDSRIKLRAAGAPVSMSEILLASIADRIEAFRYGLSEDATKGRNKPTLLVDVLYGETKKSNDKGVMSFDTPEEFQRTLARIKGE